MTSTHSDGEVGKWIARILWVVMATFCGLFVAQLGFFPAALAPPANPPGSLVYEVNLTMYEKNLKVSGLDESGILHLYDVPMKKGQRYSIYLVKLIADGACHSTKCLHTMARKEDQGVEIFDSGGNRIENEMEEYRFYDGSPNVSSLMATFTAPINGPDTVTLQLGEGIFMGTTYERDPYGASTLSYGTINLSQFGWSSQFEDLSRYSIAVHSESVDMPQRSK